MKKISLFLLTVFAVLTFSVRTHAYPKTFTSGNGYQEIAYVGLGNSNEVLAFAECSLVKPNTSHAVDVVTGKRTTEKTMYDQKNHLGIPDPGYYLSTSYNPNPETVISNITSRINFTVKPNLTVKYTLAGDYARFVKRVRIWARPNDGKKDSNTSGYLNIYTYPFDSRDPIGKSGAILLAETTDLNAKSMSSSEVLETGDYVIYLSVTLKSAEDIKKEGIELPFLVNGGAGVGAVISEVSYNIPSQNLKGSEYTYTYTEEFIKENWRRKKKRNGSCGAPYFYEEVDRKIIKSEVKTGILDKDVNIQASSDVVKVTMQNTISGQNNVSRIIVPARQVMFAPRDYYSKYYRIPAIVTTSNGTLIAVSDARKHRPHDIANDIDMLARRSTDNGKSWSTPITIAKGQMRDGNDTPTDNPNNMSCRYSVGYGDAALAALPNGKVLLTMIEGAGIHEDKSNLKTYASYCISHDNGMTWSAPKRIEQKLYGFMRGCIAPGNMCVVKDGILKGKVLAAFRSYKNHNGGRNAGSYFLVYDPATDTWSNQIGTARLNTTKYDDETQIVEIGKDKFLLSIRIAGDDKNNDKPSAGEIYRAYGELSVADGSYTFTKVANLGKNNAQKQKYCTWGTDANGALASVTDIKGTNYILQTIVAQKQNGNRTSLTIVTAKNYTGGDITWKHSLNISDPFNAIEETAQYSSMCIQPDGNVGILFEEATNAIRADFSHNHFGSSGDGTNGDYIMNSVFMSLRPGDIVANAVAPEVDNLERPIIQPITQVYNSQSTVTQGSRPEKVVITHNNIVEPPVKGESVSQVRTTYTVRYVGKNANKEDVTVDLIYSSYDTDWVREADGKLPGENKGNPKYQFDKNSQTHEIQWSEIEAKLIEKNIIAGTGAEIPRDAVIYVEAQCTRPQGTRISKSLESSERYHFIYPTRNVIIKAMSTSGVGAGAPTLVGGGRQVGSDQVIVVPSGDFVQISGLSATDNPFIKFSKFTYGPTFDSPELVEKDNNITNGNGISDLTYMNPQQIKFTLTDNVVNNYRIESLPGYDGKNDNVLCIYVWYDVNVGEIGAKTQVTTNYHRNTEGNIAIRDIAEAEIVSKSQLATNGDLENDFSPAFLPEDTNQSAPQSYLNAAGQPNADYGQVTKDASKYLAADPLYVPHDYNRWGIHLNVAVLPDANTLKNLNAVVMFVSNGNYLKRDGKYVYALLQGSLRPNRLLAQDAEFVGQWYASQDGQTVGAVANEKFSDIPATDPEYVPRAWSYYENLRGWTTYNHMKHPEYNGVKIYDIDKCEGFEVNSKGNVGSVMIFFVADDVANVESLFANIGSTKMNAMYLMYHPISTTDNIATGTEEVKAETAGLIIANVPGGVQFIGGPVQVNIYNITGNLVKTFHLDGMDCIELPQGIYIANGQKFIVR